MPALPGPESPNFEEFKRTKRNSNELQEATGRLSGCGSPHLSLFPKAPFLFESPAIGDSGCEQMEMIELSCTWAGQPCTSKHRKSNQAEHTRAPPDILTEFSEPTSTILNACKFANHPPTRKSIMRNNFMEASIMCNGATRVFRIIALYLLCWCLGRCLQPPFAL